MADGTHISWTDATWNPITGCSVISPGCSPCYAMVLAGTRMRHHPSRAGLTQMTKGGPVWTGEVRFNEQWLFQPLKWTRPRRIFVVAHGDLFHEGVPDQWLDRIFAVMTLAPQHQFQVLTKRPARMLAYLSGGRDLYQRILRAANEPRNWKRSLIGIPVDTFDDGAWHRNILLGTSVETQRYADERREPLAALAERGWRTWVSYEPALGPVDWRGWNFVRWFVSGGQSGKDARPSHPDWHRATRDFCVAQGIPYHFKQWGEWLPEDEAYNRNLKAIKVSLPENGMYRVGKRAAGAMLDGREWRQFPEARS
jgi:protein gp37